MFRIALNHKLKGLVMAFASYKHDCWVIDRQNDGWSHGVNFDEERRKDPKIKPFDYLSHEVCTVHIHVHVHVHVHVCSLCNNGGYYMYMIVHDQGLAKYGWGFSTIIYTFVSVLVDSCQTVLDLPFLSMLIAAKLY